MIITAAILFATALILFGWSRKCRHEWEHVAQSTVMKKGSVYPVGTQYIQRCTKYGKMKQVTL